MPVIEGAAQPQERLVLDGHVLTLDGEKSRLLSPAMLCCYECFNARRGEVVSYQDLSDVLEREGLTAGFSNANTTMHRFLSVLRWFGIEDWMTRVPGEGNIFSPPGEESGDADDDEAASAAAPQDDGDERDGGEIWTPERIARLKKLVGEKPHLTGLEISSRIGGVVTRWRVVEKAEELKLRKLLTGPPLSILYDKEHPAPSYYTW